MVTSKGLYPKALERAQQRHGPYWELTVAQNPPESDKAQRYLQQLDEALCAGQWSEVPELCRKVDKHAPHRKCQPPPAYRNAYDLTRANKQSRHHTYRTCRGANSRVPCPTALNRRLNRLDRLDWPVLDHPVAVDCH